MGNGTLIYGGGLGSANGGVNTIGASTLYGSTPSYPNSGSAAVTVSGSVYTDVLYAGSDVNMEYTGGGDTWDDLSNSCFSTLVQNNVIAGWTYGAGMRCEQWGDSYNIGNEMMVSTFEESGWYTTSLFGNSFGIINNGVVGWFVSGGSWETQNETGNTTIQIYKGSFPNAYVGGNYGNTGAEVIQGNSKVSIYGGDFQSAKALCGAAYNGGSVRGNSQVSLDLVGPNGCCPDAASNPTGDLYMMNSGTTMQLNASIDTPGSSNPMTGTINPNTGSWFMTTASTVAPTLSASDAMIAQATWFHNSLTVLVSSINRNLKT